ncbi:VOC family protein [Mesorhizobium sp. M1A.F.Ca.IN.020.06.1.1]|uniref:glyoxalase superfamily protein n=1 Tax=unclassified Mesorhizobium TaxID=325217 RepID=UPI000BAFDAC8|nr:MULTISPECIES: glyoxalase superfamily protein [unclassified Mesorhizobium]PBB34045.1 glyoxalase/bleomycin resistance/extradiol dioxygenase family protein [Mesorhizobium sp. WSM3882]RUV00390.1 VOC family protein [Mesorhizobium sp. M1A.F.Ca.IN.020.03.2.1]RUV89313.1 VOC family protein [Mesorhizobium sp. M1A.F.Ca.IN.020.32.1.1]RUW04733.1 VOC family protein [Mesorhizobium sp. M1A.F.Ca.IN.022.05.2.1]RUW21155.1 VOC family protein [Mesorhizobium sp. M1A.F.Ca.IN.020.06.1.1]
MPKLGTVTPILRMFDTVKAREFYLGFLGFEVRFEHRFDDNAPLYMGVARDGCELHLSEHHGDGSPGANIRIETDGIIELHREFKAKNYRFNRPGLETTPWQTKEVTVIDPFGNRLTFFERD